MIYYQQYMSERARPSIRGAAGMNHGPKSGVDARACQPLPPGHPLIARRAEVEQKVLANLLRLNHERAGK
jgi:hypothetical protein